MFLFNWVKANVVIFALFIIVVGCATGTSKNLPECKEIILLEAERIEKQFDKTVKESSLKLESIFVPENFGGDKNKALMAKGAYIAIYNHTFREQILKIQLLPSVYKMGVQKEEYTIHCDNLDKLKGVSDKAIKTHSDIWEQALEVAKTFWQK